MDETWTAVLSGAFAGLGTSVTVAGINHRLARRQDLDRERRHARREAASDLTAALRDLRALSSRLGRVDLPRSDVARAFLSWVAAFDRQRHLLPAEWPHLGSSVRAAVGTVFGAVTLADVRPDLEDCPLADADFEWQEHAYAYLDYLVDRVSRWGNAERVKAPLTFDPWLIETERRLRSL
ncbi:hypothetical protein [Nocardioides limicola]|uniref:hypothetical protein n=1 Tax=Nocardioides limicola TaxID=2803368 RepID=UPI00193B6DEA|nr:hypothetical protein [Nocardioides sp. DJM-14]